MATIVAFAVLTQSHKDYARQQLWASIYQNDIQTELNLASGISHQKFTVSEGSEKRTFVALVNDLPIEQISEVALRTDTVEMWSHSINSLVKAEKNIDLDPIRVTLNLENEDHLHLFESNSTDCEISQQCASLSLTEEGVVHRTLFDSVHDIGSDYDTFQSPQLKKAFSLLPEMELIENTKKKIVYRHQISDDQYIDYHFDPQTLAREKKIIYVALGEQWYEMAVKDYLVREVLSATEFANIFDAQAYNLEQKKVIPL